jgi:hypothetical protein
MESDSENLSSSILVGSDRDMKWPIMEFGVELFPPHCLEVLHDDRSNLLTRVNT